MSAEVDFLAIPCSLLDAAKLLGQFLQQNQLLKRQWLPEWESVTAIGLKLQQFRNDSTSKQIDSIVAALPSKPVGKDKAGNNRNTSPAENATIPAKAEVLDKVGTSGKKDETKETKRKRGSASGTEGTMSLTSGSEGHTYRNLLESEMQIGETSESVKKRSKKKKGEAKKK